MFCFVFNKLNIHPRQWYNRITLLTDHNQALLNSTVILEVPSKPHAITPGRELSGFSIPGAVFWCPTYR